MKQRKVETNDRFIAFDEYIGRKYGSELKQLLQDDLYDGYDGSASIRVDRRSAKIESVVYWQDSASEISGIITYSAKCEIDIDGRTEACVSEINIRVDACIGSDRIDCDFTPFHENISKARRQRPEDRLDRYLLPRAGKQRVEEICESILRHYCHDAIVRNEIVAPEDLAKALGLKITRLPLCDMDNKGSLLITEETFLPVCSTYNKTDFVPTRVDGNTIVINDNCSRLHRNIGNNITHECYHFAGQKLFNLFQKISRAEYPSLGGKRKKHNSDEADTYDWMEWQAFIGSSFLRYPGSYARDEAPGLLKHYAPDSKHDGEMYDSAIRDIADARHLSPFTVCSVLKHQDHIGAKGTFVYVNGEQILPFAFDKVKMIRYTVMFVPVRADEVAVSMKAFTEALNELLDERLGSNRHSRCLIPQPDGSVKVCPKVSGNNHAPCSACPHRGEYEREDRSVVSLDELAEEDFNPMECVPSAESLAMDVLTLDDLLKHLRSINPVYAEIVSLGHEGFEKKEILQRLGVKSSQAYELYNKAKILTREFLRR